MRDEQRAGASAPEWWTDADQSELDLLVFELVKVGFIHRERCRTCALARSGQGPLCDRMRKAIEAVTDWRDGRILRSKAEWLRVREQAQALTRAAERRKEWSGAEPPRPATTRAG